jgi:zinc finger protein
MAEDLGLETEDLGTEIDSYCFACGGTGKTRLLSCNVPFFQSKLYADIVLMAFNCEECGFKNNEVQSTQALAEQGVRYTLTVDSKEKLNREVIKSENASITIVELGFEIPRITQKASLNTVEGVLMKAIEGLEHEQPYRRVRLT